jgi:COP9 signalosome complex subunit 4
MHDVDDAELNLHFRLSAARIQDSNRQFLQAAKSYHDISFSPAIAEEERLHTLGMAIKCAILAPAGPLRSRSLGLLYKDERSAGLEEYGILEKMFFDRLLSAAEVDKFAQDLAPHQLAKTSDGSTVLAKAVVEHNLLSASRLYSNIGFDELGLLLGLDGDKAEDTTAKMIEQGRLAGSIDQLERVIWFEGGDASGEKGSGRAEVPVGKEMRRWDGNVQALAEDVERLTDALQAEFPDFVAAQIAV